MFRVGVGGFETTRQMRENINEVLDSGRLTYGPFCKQLERAFATLHGCSFGVLSNSGTSSLQVALQTLKHYYKWEDGDEVIIPATTFVATANIVLHSNMVPVPVDVNLRTYNINPDLIAEAVTKRTRAIIPVHLFGQPANMTLVRSIAQTYDLKIIEDSCETVLATHKRARVGSMGDIGCFSFYTAHHVAAGVGGIAITNDAVMAEAMRSLVNHGRDGIYISMDDKVPSEQLARRFRFDRLGHSFRLTELEAGIALAQLSTIRDQINRRQAIAHFYNSCFSELPLVIPAVLPGNTHSYMMYPLMTQTPVRDELVAYLEENGIETRPLLPLINQPVYQGMWDVEKYPNARFIDERGFYIGCHPLLTPEDTAYVTERMVRFYARN